ncbi:MAG: 2-dehydropantoate 2-reductase [Clostridiales bacterium]|nr:2-dehydropantoate 2-reductase [Clostridiales bacterium]
MTATKARIAIYGAGAMGTVLGSLLTLGGLKNVELITRNKAHVNGLNEQGARISCTAEDKELTIKVCAKTPDEMEGKYDVVFLMTKQKSNGEILEFLTPYLHEDSVVCTTQNGLPEASVAAVVGAQRTYGGVASFGATFIGGGKVSLTSKFDGMRMQVSGYQNDNAKTELLVKILAYAGRAVENESFAQITDNLQGARWSKLAINAAFSGLSVVTGCTFGEIAKKRKSRKIALGILRECMDVANALGVSLEPMQGHDMQKMLGGRGFFKTQLSLFLLPIAMKKHKKLISGMRKDVENGRKCEIDFINGAVCKAGKEAGVETPLCDKVVEVVHGIENGLYETTYKNVEFFKI